MIKLIDILFISCLIIILFMLIKKKNILNSNTHTSINESPPPKTNNITEVSKYPEIKKPIYPYHIDALLLFISNALRDINRPFHIISYNGSQDVLTLGIFRTDIITKKSLRRILAKYNINYVCANGSLNNGLVYKFIHNNTNIIITIVYQTGHGAWFKMFSDIHDNYILRNNPYILNFFKYEHAYGVNNLLVLDNVN